jgi:hypothetical protein
VVARIEKAIVTLVVGSGGVSLGGNRFYVVASGTDVNVFSGLICFLKKLYKFVLSVYFAKINCVTVQHKEVSFSST